MSYKLGKTEASIDVCAHTLTSQNNGEMSRNTMK